MTGGAKLEVLKEMPATMPPSLRGVPPPVPKRIWLAWAARGERRRAARGAAYFGLGCRMVGPLVWEKDSRSVGRVTAAAAADCYGGGGGDRREAGRGFGDDLD